MMKKPEAIQRADEAARKSSTKTPLGVATPIVQRQLKKWLSDQCLADALESYRRHGKAAWEILFAERPEAWLRAIMCLLPAEDITPPDAIRLVVTGVPRKDEVPTEVALIEHQREH